MKKHCPHRGITSFFLAMMLLTLPGILHAEEPPPGFAFNEPGTFAEHPNFHGGAGTIRYSEYWGPEDYQTRLQFMRVVVIPPKCSIGEYRLVDADEVIVVLKGFPDVTINGRTGRLAKDTLVPVKNGGTLGIYNPTESDVMLAWTAATLKKGSYNPVNLGNDLTQNTPEGLIPFPHLFLNYWVFGPTGNPSHLGLGSLVETLGGIGFDYFDTHLNTRFFIVPAGASIGYHTHFTNEEHFFVVKGTGRATVDDVTRPLKAFDCIKVGINSTHGIYNNSAGDLVIFFTNMPKEGVEGWGKLHNTGDDLSDR